MGRSGLLYVSLSGFGESPWQGVDFPSKEVLAEEVEATLWLATLLSCNEVLLPFTNLRVDHTPIEHMLAYQAWRSKKDFVGFLTAMEKAGYTGIFDFWAPIFGEASPKELRSIFEEWASLFSWNDQMCNFNRSYAELAASWVAEGSSLHESEP